MRHLQEGDESNQGCPRQLLVPDRRHAHGCRRPPALCHRQADKDRPEPARRSVARVRRLLVRPASGVPAEKSPAKPTAVIARGPCGMISTHVCGNLSHRECDLSHKPFAMRHLPLCTSPAKLAFGLLQVRPSDSRSSRKAGFPRSATLRTSNRMAPWPEQFAQSYRIPT